MNNKILVTGGSGLLGNELIHQLLNKGNSVKAIVHKTPILIKHRHLEVVVCDLLDVVTLEEIMQDVTHVYHCAGLVSFTKGNKNLLFKTNIDTTVNIVNASLHAKIKKFVHVSSIVSLGRDNQFDLINENLQWNAENNFSTYGYTKYLGELEVWRGIAEGLNAVIVNPSIILGPGNWDEGSTAIFKKVHDHLKWYSEGVNGFVDVRDVCRAMVLLMEAEISAERFIVSAYNLSYKDLIFQIADSFKKPRPSQKINPFLAEIVWRMDWLRSLITGKEPLITKETVKTAQSISHYDNSKLKKTLLNFEYRSLTDTIDHTCITLQQMFNK